MSEKIMRLVFEASENEFTVSNGEGGPAETTRRMVAQIAYTQLEELITPNCACHRCFVLRSALAITGEIANMTLIEKRTSPEDKSKLC